MKTYRYLMPENNRRLFQSLYSGQQHYVPPVPIVALSLPVTMVAGKQ